MLVILIVRQGSDLSDLSNVLYIASFCHRCYDIGVLVIPQLTHFYLVACFYQMLNVTIIFAKQYFTFYFRLILPVDFSERAVSLITIRSKGPFGAEPDLD